MTRMAVTTNETWALPAVFLQEGPKRALWGPGRSMASCRVLRMDRRLPVQDSRQSSRTAANIVVLADPCSIPRSR